jgi:Fungal Zn(2)-Cys(6) binuclear cluster domain
MIEMNLDLEYPRPSNFHIRERLNFLPSPPNVFQSFHPTSSMSQSSQDVFHPSSALIAGFMPFESALTPSTAEPPFQPQLPSPDGYFVLSACTGPVTYPSLEEPCSMQVETNTQLHETGNTQEGFWSQGETDYGARSFQVTYPSDYLPLSVQHIVYSPPRRALDYLLPSAQHVVQQRALNAGEVCRRRKRKCDEARPNCSACAADEQQCYDSPPKRDASSVEERLRRLETMVAELSKELTELKTPTKTIKTQSTF